ncbi:hypothetical protein RHMOL_Rhmol08G0144800 [Rhododendron molle]|uniref:Uncharacterized protein n=1 Tax=Rhododendron molle TaxID=49168 RepID=A0ACC0MQF1_RHOML|nr:hypothetical protein RHMOL_Rhmol08G0144800 [Rhododendron molle]
MFFFLKNMLSPSSVFSAYASLSASFLLFQTMFNQFLPNKAQQFILSAFQYYLSPQLSSNVTLIIEENINGLTRNELFEASETYLFTKVSSSSAEKLKVSKGSRDQNFTTRFAQCEQIFDSFGGMELKWRFHCQESRKDWKSEDDRASERQYWFELSFHKEHRDKVLESYLGFILSKAKALKNEKKVVKLYTLAQCSTYGVAKWDSMNFEHPSNFNTLAMDPDMKRDIIEDLDRFVRRKEFYKKVGKAWKRGYLLYGPPGTGKSSLIAAMANYLKFDVYDLQLSDLNSDSYLRKVLLATTNRSILVIEDIDCSVDRTTNAQFQCVAGGGHGELQLTLSSLLNFIDGLWSSCGDERIIIFTTNHKDRLDPALLRPGRMDMHIHMSYCSFQGFKLLASNYLDINNHHGLFGQIEGLMENTEVTPAEVAEELMKSEDADIALSGVVNFLKRKKVEANSTADTKEEKSSAIDVGEAKRMKLEDVVRNSGRKIGKSVVRRKCRQR